MKSIFKSLRLKYCATLLLLFFLVFAVKGQTGPNDSLLNLLKSNLSVGDRIDVLLQLADRFRVTGPDSSLYYADQAFKLAQQSNDSFKIIRANYYQASYDYNKGKPERAFATAQKNIEWLRGKKEYQSQEALHESFSGLCLMKMNQIKEALEHFYKALNLAEQSNDIMTQLRARVNIGWAMMELNRFGEAVESFTTALKLIDEKKLNIRNATIYNNLASSYGALNKLDSADKYSRIAISVAHEQNDLNAEANGYYILGTTQIKYGKHEDALKSFLAAKPLREKIGDPFFIVSDLSEMANLYAKLKKPAEGIAVSKQALEIATTNKIDAKLPMIYSAMAENYQVAGDFKQAAETYKKINALQDSLYADANPKALAEMQTKYETEKKEQEILLQRIQLSRKNLIIIGIAVLVGLAVLLSVSLYRRYRLKQESKLQAAIMRQQEIATKAVMEAEEKERQRIAKDLHDGVGQIMSAAKMNLSSFENELNSLEPHQKEKFDKIMSLVDESCREVRTVSHNMMPNALLKAGLSAAIREFIDKIDTKVLKVDLYSEGLNERLDGNVETVLYRVIQECVNNVIKHSGANHLDISLIKDKDGISATIEDNGKGFDARESKESEGLGLKNIRTRIEYLKGTVDFDSTPGKGTLVAIHVPTD